MTDRFSPSLPILGKVEASLVHRVADVALGSLRVLQRSGRAVLSAPALVHWRFAYRAMRLDSVNKLSCGSA